VAEKSENAPVVLLARGRREGVGMLLAWNSTLVHRRSALAAIARHVGRTLSRASGAAIAMALARLRSADPISNSRLCSI
jgi:hypothetical protein